MAGGNQNGYSVDIELNAYRETLAALFKREARENSQQCLLVSHFTQTSSDFVEKLKEQHYYRLF